MLLPTTPEPQLRKPKTPPDHHDHEQQQQPPERRILVEEHKRSSFNSLSSFLLSPKSNPIQTQTRTCLVFSVILFQLLLLLITVPLHRLRAPLAVATPRPSAASVCPLGRLYVYDLPAAMNADHVTEAVSNSGLGPSVGSSFSGVVPPKLASSWYHTDQFSLEVIFHSRLLAHPCRTLSPENATAFYVPFYAGLAVGPALFANDSSAADRDRHCDDMLKWLADQPYFARSGGWDHFLAMGRITWDFRRSSDGDWGSGCIYRPAMRNITRLLIERNPWDYFDVGVPYPTGFHPGSNSDVVSWQEFVRSKPREVLFAFAGAPRRVIRDDFRGKLLRQCRDATGCRAVDCSGGRCNNGSSAILEAFLDAEFCLQPRGDSFTRRSVFDCMVAGAVPVLFWKRSVYYQYEWFLPGGEGGGFSVFVDREGVKNGTVNVADVLGRIPTEERRRMRERVVELIPSIVYARDGSTGVRDALDVAVDSVFRRIKEQEEWDYKW